MINLVKDDMRLDHELAATPPETDCLAVSLVLHDLISTTTGIIKVVVDFLDWRSTACQQRLLLTNYVQGLAANDWLNATVVFSTIVIH